KPAGALKLPEGLEQPVQDVKMPRSAWKMYAAGKPGDYVVHEAATNRMKYTLFDIADHAYVTVSEVTIKVLDKEMVTRSAVRYLFPEPDAPPAKKEEPEKRPKSKVVQKPADRKIKVAGKEITIDVTEVYVDGKLQLETWMSKQVPLGGVVRMALGIGQV